MKTILRKINSALLPLLLSLIVMVLLDIEQMEVRDKLLWITSIVLATSFLVDWIRWCWRKLEGGLLKGLLVFSIVLVLGFLLYISQVPESSWQPEQRVSFVKGSACILLVWALISNFSIWFNRAFDTTQSTQDSELTISK